MPRSGVIPAGAGLTVERAQGGIRAWDHPRGCGAHQKAETIKSTVQGSSPRVRGSLKQYFRFRSFLGIIPAGAGLTEGFISYILDQRDHPRRCGAHSSWNLSILSASGSSPRVRGSLVLLDDNAHLLGVIPAGAGLTLLGTYQFFQRRDHPRGCGAHQEIGRASCRERV